MICSISNTPIQYSEGTYVGKKIKQLVLDDIITSETTFEAQMSSAWHYHANPHFSHILVGGSKERRRAGSDLQVAGKGLYYYPGVAHQNVNYQKNTRIFNLELTTVFFEKYGLAMPKESAMFEDRALLNVNGLVQALREHYCADTATSLGLQQLCVSLVQSLQPEADQLFPEWTRKINTILHDCWQQPLSLTFLSDELDLHPVTISRYFSHYFGCSAGEYLRRIKIERALPLIRSGRYTLTEVAYQCGFADQAHFNKVFSLITGWRPKQYQNISKKG